MTRVDGVRNECVAQTAQVGDKVGEKRLRWFRRVQSRAGGCTVKHGTTRVGRFIDVLREVM